MTSRKYFLNTTFYRTVGFDGGSDCANMGSGVATTVVGGWKVSLALSIS